MPRVLKPGRMPGVSGMSGAAARRLPPGRPPRAITRTSAIERIPSSAAARTTSNREYRAVDEDTMKLGLLMEAAQANQKVAEASLKKLKAAANDLAAAVRDEVRHVLQEELHCLAADSKRASDALHAVRRAANIRIALWSVGMTMLCSVIPLALACWIIPSRTEITVLRAKHAELASKIAELEERGGRMDLRRCGDGARLCVRVDRKAPAYGEKSDYLIVGGY